jgi:hypothetical protein
VSIAEALNAARDSASALVREHIDWALAGAGADGAMMDAQATESPPPC